MKARQCGGPSVGSRLAATRASRLLLFLFAVAILFAVAATAQMLYGTLTGNVTDATGAVVPGAKVEAQNVATGLVREATTDGNGIYRFLSLQPGVYKVTIAAPSFTKAVSENVGIDANVTKRVDAQLKIATTEQVLEVSTEAPLLQTDTADVHTELRAKQIESLPIMSSQGRSFQALYRIVPGFGLPVEANSAAANTQRSMSANVNGQSIQGNNTRIDGAQNSYPWLPANIAYVPPADAIETVNVVTNSYDPEQGTAGGAAVNVQIKSGTNDFHGSAHEFHTDHLLRTKDYFDPLTTTVGGVTTPFKKKKNIQNQFGGTIGGPIIKDKLFFFGDFERTTQRQLATKTMSVPTDAVRAGDFSAFVPAGVDCNNHDPSSPSHAVAGCIYDPNTGNADGTNRLAFVGNKIPSTQTLDPAAVTLLDLIPRPNLPGEQNNYFAVGSSIFNRNTMDAKVNWIPSTNSTVFGRYSLSQGYIFDPPALGKAGSDATAGGQLGNAYSRIQNVGMGATYAFSPTVIMDWNLGFTRQRLNAEALDIGTNFGLDTLQIPGTNGPTHQQGGIPAFQFITSTYSNLGNPNTGNPFLFRDNQWVTNLNLSVTRGKHAVRLGLEFNRAGINHFQPQGGSFQTARGSFKFNGNPTAINPATATGNPAETKCNQTDGQKIAACPSPNQYNSFASFLLGLPSEVGKATQTVGTVAIRWNQWGLYIRDQFQVTQRLTLNYGVRWEYYPMATSDHGRGIRYLDPETMSVMIGGAGRIPVNNNVDVGHGQVLPRLGVAYRLTDSTVIRGGYGMSADPNNFRFVRNWYPNVINSDVYGEGGTSSYAPAASLTGKVSFAPYTGTHAIGAGIPEAVLPDISQGVISMPDNLVTGTLANPYRRGYIHSFNLTVEQNFLGFVGSAGYVGTRGIRPLTNLNLNAGVMMQDAQGNAISAQNSAPLNIKFHHLNTDSCPETLGGLCKGWSTINIEMPFKDNKYDSLQTRLTRRFGGSQLGVVYVWSKAINYSDNEELNYLLFPNPAYWEKNRGLASFDRTHNLQAYGVYELPFGSGQRWAQSGIASKLAGGWQFNWVFSHLSGSPFTITANANSLSLNGTTQTADVVGPIRITGCEISSKNGACTYFDPNAFAQPTGQRFGTGGRDIVRGPGFTNLDLSLFRDFSITEKVKFQLQVNAFSVTNTPHFANPGTLDVSQIKRNSSDGSLAANNAFGVITSTFGGNSGTNLNGSRTIWFGGKITF